MARKPAVSDAALTRALAAYAGMVRLVLDDPERWLGVDEEPPADAGLPARVIDAVKDRALGELTPASAQWAQQPLAERIDWWVGRIAIVGGLAAAAPRFAGALADRSRSGGTGRLRGGACRLRGRARARPYHSRPMGAAPRPGALRP